MPGEPEPFVTLLFYRYRPYARLVLLLYVIGVVLFFAGIAHSLSSFWVVTITILIIVPPVIGAILPRSIFSIRSADKRHLRLSPAGVEIGSDLFPMDKMERIAVYVEAFYGFRYRSRRSGFRGLGYSSYGDGNKLSFRTSDQVFDIEFLLPNYKTWKRLYAVIDAWKEAGAPVELKEAFKRDFVINTVGPDSPKAK